MQLLCSSELVALARCHRLITIHDYKCAEEVEAAYMRSDLFERRRWLMEDWVAYLPGAEQYCSEGLK